MKKYGKFAALIVVILGTLLWIAMAGSGEEIRQMGPTPARSASA
jgi:hypothetical protein